MNQTRFPFTISCNIRLQEKEGKNSLYELVIVAIECGLVTLNLAIYCRIQQGHLFGLELAQLGGSVAVRTFWYCCFGFGGGGVQVL